MAKAKKQTPGSLSPEDMRKMVNKLAGGNVSYDLNKDNPTEVPYWIPTGCTWLDAVICRGQMAGIPGSKISELAGMQSTGKSYLALQIAANAQKMGITVIYGDPESAISPDFMSSAGCDLDTMQYIQPPDLETWYEIMELFLAQRAPEQKFLFVLDSLAACPTRSDVDGTFNPNETVGVKARINAKAMQKITMPLAEAQSTFLILNQLKDNISGMAQVPVAKYATDNQRYRPPGGRAAEYFASLRIWLTNSSSKKLKVYDDNGFRIGSHVKARIEKSRFGTQDRTCEFKILWGDTVGVKDEESIFEAIKHSDLVTVGAWKSLDMGPGKEPIKWQGEGFAKLMNENADFKARAMEILQEEVVMAFENKTGDASRFYDKDDGPPVEKPEQEEA
jgi:recombination protein RecA